MQNDVEFEIIVSSYGNVGVFRRTHDGGLRLWTYARTIEAAIYEFRHWPVMIYAQNTPVYEEV
jgi:hypothetical protein